MEAFNGLYQKLIHPTLNVNEDYLVTAFFIQKQRKLFVYEQPKSNPEKATKEFPYVLMTGRGTSAQWHTGTRTGKSNILKKMYPEKCYALKSTNLTQSKKILMTEIL